MRGELMLRDIFRNHGYEGVKRGSVFQGTSDVVGIPGIHAEVKFVEKLNVRKAMAQAEEEAIKRKDGIPVVFHKTSREPWLVTMRIHEWMELYKVWEEQQRNEE
jgi:hypothetical protein